MDPRLCERSNPVAYFNAPSNNYAMMQTHTTCDWPHYGESMGKPSDTWFAQYSVDISSLTLLKAQITYSIKAMETEIGRLFAEAQTYR